MHSSTSLVLFCLLSLSFITGTQTNDVESRSNVIISSGDYIIGSWICSMMMGECPSSVEPKIKNQNMKETKNQTDEKIEVNEIIYPTILKLAKTSRIKNNSVMKMDSIEDIEMKNKNVDDKGFALRKNVKVQSTCGGSYFSINMNYQASDLVSFIVSQDVCYNSPYETPLNYISDLSVIRRASARQYVDYLSIDNNAIIDYEAETRKLCWVFRYDAPLATNITLNFTVDLCCNHGCGIDSNEAKSMYGTQLDPISFLVIVFIVCMII